MNFNNITIAGGGILGSRIAFQAAYCGFNVKIWLRSQESINRTKQRIDTLYVTYKDTIELMDTPEGKAKENWAPGIADKETFNKQECLEKLSRVPYRITYTTDLQESISSCGLLIESIVEDLNEKIAFYKSINDYLKDNTVIVTNSSTFLPSKIAKHIKKPERFLSLHFTNRIWVNNNAEIMAHDKTDNTCFMAIMEFSKQIRMIPIPVSKENPGYVVNSLLIPFLLSSMDLYLKKVTDYKTIDIAWTSTTGMTKGPFQLIDQVGLPIAYKIASQYTKIPSFLAPYDFKGICKLLKSYIDQGKLGEESGEGFYKYNK